MALGKRKYWNRNTVASHCLSKALKDIFVLRSHPPASLHVGKNAPTFSPLSLKLLPLPFQRSAGLVGLGYSQDSKVGMSMPYFKEHKRRQSRGRSLVCASKPLLEDFGQRCLMRGSS